MKISMVIPAFGEQHLLDRSLETIAPQRGQLYETIVVDDGSETPLTVPSWVTLKRINRPPAHRGSSAAKNVGATFATGDWLLIADSDFLHSPDAVESIVKATQFYIARVGEKIILNTVRFEVPKGYPEFEIDRLQDYLDMAESEDRLTDPDMTEGGRAWEQNFSMINRAFFWSVGGYDESAFQSWGFNNHDLDFRVIRDGGYLTSTIKRISNGKRLITVHQHHNNGVPNRVQADREFTAKWGQTFYHNLATELFGRKREDYVI